MRSPRCSGRSARIGIAGAIARRRRTKLGACGPRREPSASETTTVGTVPRIRYCRIRSNAASRCWKMCTRRQTPSRDALSHSRLDRSASIATRWPMVGARDDSGAASTETATAVGPLAATAISTSAGSAAGASSASGSADSTSGASASARRAAPSASASTADAALGVGPRRRYRRKSSPLKTGSSTSPSSRARRARRAALRDLVAEPGRLHREVLRVEPGRQQQLAVVRGELFADLEAELAAAPTEHAHHGALDVLAAQRREPIGRQAALALKRLVERDRLAARETARAIEGLCVDAFLGEQQRAQVFGLSLDRRALDEPVAQHDPPVAALGAKHQHPGLPRQTHDLENVREAQVLEAADETHPTPATHRPRDLPVAIPLQRENRPADS